MGKCIQFLHQTTKKLSIIYHFFQVNHILQKALSDYPNSSLSTKENSIKNNIPIRTIKFYQKIIPENLMGSLERKKIIKIVKIK